jgi:hypothetical protein
MDDPPMGNANPVAHFEKHFTLAGANALLPWVRTIFARVHKLVSRAGQTTLKLAPRPGEGGGNGHGSGHGKAANPAAALAEAPAPDPAQAASGADPALDPYLFHLSQQEMLALAQELLKALVARGIVIQDVERGLIDFPGWRQGQEILLCYELRDGDAIGFWHGLHTGFAGRRSLDEAIDGAPEGSDP